jgi:hypothetical protein
MSAKFHPVSYVRQDAIFNHSPLYDLKQIEALASDLFHQPFTLSTVSTLALATLPPGPT